MEDILVGMAIKWVVGKLSDIAGTVDWQGLKDKAAADIKSSFHPAWLPKKVLEAIDAEAVSAVDGVIDACQALTQERAEWVVVVKAVADKDGEAALAALKAMLTPFLNKELAALLAA